MCGACWSRWSIKMKQMLLLIVLVGFAFMGGCAEEQSYAQETHDGIMLTFEVGNDKISESNRLTTYTVENKKDSVFERWQAYNQQRMMQEEWDAFVEREDDDEDDDKEKQEKSVRNSPLNVSCDFVACE